MYFDTFDNCMSLTMRTRAAIVVANHVTPVIEYAETVSA